MKLLMKPIELLGILMICAVAPIGLRRPPIPEEVNLQPSKGYRYSNYEWYDASKLLTGRHDHAGE